MRYKKESLEKLILLIEEICHDDQNKWFKELLLNKILFDGDFLEENSSPQFGAYFRLLKKQFRLKANKLYSDIKDKKLKCELVEDCIKMYWYQINNDVDQLFLHAFYQMENLLNFYAYKSNAHTKIETNKDFYTHYFNENFIVSAYSSFFNKDETIKPIDKVTIWPKIVYWAYDSERVEYLKKNNSHFYNLINVRNETSHRNSVNIKSEQNSVEFIRLNDFSAFGYYMNILKEIIESLHKINIRVEKKSFSPTKVTLTGPKIIGKIDL
jgi:hypothetical protein